MNTYVLQSGSKVWPLRIKKNRRVNPDGVGSCELIYWTGIFYAASKKTTTDDFIISYNRLFPVLNSAVLVSPLLGGYVEHYGSMGYAYAQDSRSANSIDLCFGNAAVDTFLLEYNMDPHRQAAPLNPSCPYIIEFPAYKCLSRFYNQGTHSSFWKQVFNFNNDNLSITKDFIKTIMRRTTRIEKEPIVTNWSNSADKIKSYQVDVFEKEFTKEYEKVYRKVFDLSIHEGKNGRRSIMPQYVAVLFNSLVNDTGNETIGFITNSTSINAAV